VTDNVSRTIGTHQIKFGFDYRRLNPEAALLPYLVQYVFGTLPNVLANTAPVSFTILDTPPWQMGQAHSRTFR
jgi:hypothetical protein